MANITLSYAKTLKEVFGNNGAIANSITIKATNGTFWGNNGDAVGSVTGVPEGLKAVLVKTSGTTAKLSFTGAATAHNNAAEAAANGTSVANNTQAIASETTTAAASGAAQVDTITLSGKYEEGDVITLGGFGGQIAYIVEEEDIKGTDAATLEAVSLKLVEAVNALGASTVTAAATAADGVLTLTADAVNAPFTTTATAANPAAAGGLKITFTQADFLTGTISGDSLVVSDIDFDFTDPYTDGTLSIAPPVAAIGKDALAALTGTAAAGTKVAVFNGTKLVGEATANEFGTWSVASPTAKAGVYNFTVREVLDATAKLYGPSSPSVQYTWDNKPPTAPTVTAIKGATSNTMPVLSGKTEKGATVEVFAKGGKFSEATSLGKAVADAKTGAWVLLPNKVLDKDGAYEITAKATDAAGNTADSKKTVTLTIDTEVAKNTITVGDIAKGAVRLTGEAEAGATVQLYGGADGSVALGKVIKADKNGAWKTSIKPGDGKHLITAVVTDAAGNSSVSEVAEAVVDTFAFALIDKVEGGKLKGTSDPEADIAILAGKTKLTTKAGADGKWEVALSDDLKGSVKFSATASDKAGNKSKTFVKTLDVVAAATDTQAPTYTSAAISDTSKVVTLTFSEAVESNKATPAELKAAVKFAADGTDFVALGETDTVAIVEGKLVVTFNTALTTATNKIKVAANALKDAAGNALATEVNTLAVFAGATANDDALVGTANADTINGFAGDDTITGGKGADVLTGGDGADTFVFTYGDNAGADGAAVADIITDFVVGTDKLQFTSITDVVSGQQTDVQAAVTALAANSTAAQIATAMANANTTDLGVSFAVYNGDTYVYLEKTGATATHVEADNIFIKLTGVTTLPTFAADVVA